VQHPVDRSELLARTRKQRRHRGRIGHIGWDCQDCGGTSGSAFLSRVLERLGRPCRQHQLCALLGEQVRRGAADAR
jgi:hypothetical protein